MKSRAARRALDVLSGALDVALRLEYHGSKRADAGGTSRCGAEAIPSLSVCLAIEEGEVDPPALRTLHTTVLHMDLFALSGVSVFLSGCLEVLLKGPHAWDPSVRWRC